MTHIINFLKYNYRHNWALWFHMFCGMVGAKVFLYIGCTTKETIAGVLCIALVWEAIEWSVENKSNPEIMLKNYGSLSNYVYDTIGDYIGAVVCAWIVIL